MSNFYYFLQLFKKKTFVQWNYSTERCFWNAHQVVYFLYVNVSKVDAIANIINISALVMHR